MPGVKFTLLCMKVAYLPVGLCCALRETRLFSRGWRLPEDAFLSVLGIPEREGGLIPVRLPVRLGGRWMGLGLRSRLSTLEAALRVLLGSGRFLLRIVGLIRRMEGGRVCVGLRGEEGEERGGEEEREAN